MSKPKRYVRMSRPTFLSLLRLAWISDGTTESGLFRFKDPANPGAGIRYKKTNEPPKSRGEKQEEQPQPREPKQPEQPQAGAATPPPPRQAKAARQPAQKQAKASTPEAKKASVQKLIKSSIENGVHGDQFPAVVEALLKVRVSDLKEIHAGLDEKRRQGGGTKNELVKSISARIQEKVFGRVKTENAASSYKKLREMVKANPGFDKLQAGFSQITSGLGRSQLNQIAKVAGVKAGGTENQLKKRLLGHLEGIAAAGKNRSEKVQAPAPVPEQAQPKSNIYIGDNVAEKTATVKFIKSILGKKATATDVATLSGAPPGSEVEIDYDPGQGTIIVDFNYNNGQAVGERSIFRDGDKLVMNNELSEVEEDSQAKGMTAEMLSGQVKQAIKLGISEIRAPDGKVIWRNKQVKA